MWIRSQDKTRLVKTNYVRINGTTIEAIHSDMLCTSLATYSTEAKALKVLDEIQEMINQQEEYKAQGEDKNEGTKRLIKFVYQMPSDEQIVVFERHDNMEVKDND